MCISSVLFIYLFCHLNYDIVPLLSWESIYVDYTESLIFSEPLPAFDKRACTSIKMCELCADYKEA